MLTACFQYCMLHILMPFPQYGEDNSQEELKHGRQQEMSFTVQRYGLYSKGWTPYSTTIFDTASMESKGAMSPSPVCMLRGPAGWSGDVIWWA